MSDQSQVFLTIQGLPEDEKNLRSLLTDELGRFNPYKIYAIEKVYKRSGSYIVPKQGESDYEYKKRLEIAYSECSAEATDETSFKTTIGSPINPFEYPGHKTVVKSTCVFFHSWWPPIQEFITISAVFTNVQFLLSFDSKWDSFFGTVYISKGIPFYAKRDYDIIDNSHKKIYLNHKGVWKYATACTQAEIEVPSYLLNPINNIFFQATPAEMSPFNSSCFPPLIQSIDEYDEEELAYQKEIFAADTYTPTVYEITEMLERQAKEPEVTEQVEHSLSEEEIIELIESQINNPVRYFSK